MDYYGFTLHELGLKHTEDVEGFIGQIIKNDFYEKLVIIGFPYDQILKKIDAKELKVGAHYGPDSFRRFIRTCGVLDNREFGIKIENIKIADYGNVVAHKSMCEFSLEENQQKLFIKSLLTFERNQVNFIMGGTRDYTPFVSKALISHKYYSLEDNQDREKYNKTLIISLSSICDDEKIEENGLVTPFNRHTYLRNMEEFVESQSQLILLGAYEEHKAVGDSQFKVIPREEIDLASPENPEDFPVPIVTKAGKYFYQLLKESSDIFKCIQVDYNIQMAEAFSTEEMIEIMFLSGYFNEVKSCTISEYNPRLEDIITGQLCAEMFYYYTLGVELREKNSEVKFVKPTPKVKNIFTEGSL
ncbi:unnamed protein product [Moneuplotes crassus]|uniref:Uncharacterized protein n=2 Tax=Euplotes crassus TaxID=5936 RepID=A0AAD1XIT6_EUPCR|nr:unnamed protein product [Moneuplotes crassus]